MALPKNETATEKFAREARRRKPLSERVEERAKEMYEELKKDNWVVPWGKSQFNFRLQALIEILSENPNI